MQYPNVKNAHIVPRTYLANFAIDGKIGVRVEPEHRSLVLPIESVGTRRRFYRGTRPDGSVIDDMEWSLGEGEKAAAPLLRRFRDHWPLDLAKKGMLAELFAYQLLRGPRFKAEREELTRKILADYRRTGKLDDAVGGGEIGDTELDEAERAFMTARHGHIRMLTLGPTLTSILGSMHWTLVEFASPVVATSDHPVVIWPIGESSRSPQPTPLGVGALETLEVRLPLSPTAAVLMSWLDAPDDERASVRGARHHAATLNAFTVASADRQWFHKPGTSPPVATGKLLPLAPELIGGYSYQAAVSSKRRARVSAEVQPKIGRNLADRDVTFVMMSRST